MSRHIGRQYGESEKASDIDKSRGQAEQGRETDIVRMRSIGTGVAKHK
jgi:hypothetical protein